VLWFFFLFIWIVILFHILTDLFRDHTLSGGMKTLWVLFLVFLPFLAVLIYVISRGKGMAERSAARQQQAQEQFDSYVRSVATTGDATATPGRPDRPGQAAAGRRHHRPGRVRPPEGQSPRLTTSSSA
jgi:ABC-type multidrug transport system fused ATPase/permease subunit